MYMNIRRISAAALLIALPLLALLAIAAQAQSQTQAQSVVQGVRSLPAKLAAISGAPACPKLSRSLQKGSEGEDVRGLQRYLASDSTVYPDGQIVGTYGALTEAAVKRWQVKYNVVTSGDAATTGFGAVGAKTISAIAQVCGGVPRSADAAAPSSGGILIVSPVSGGAPLTVTVQAIVNTANVCGGGLYSIDYGDGSVQSEIKVPAGNCREVAKSLSHVYRKTGPFVVTLSSGAHRTMAVVTVK